MTVQLPRLLAASAALACVALVVAPPATPRPGAVTATLTLVVDAEGSGSAPVETTLRIVGPAGEPELGRIVEADPSSPEYRTALARLLNRLGLYRLGQLQTRLALTVDREPERSVSGGQATIFFAGKRELGDYVASGVPGVWDLERHRGRLRICVARSTAVPAGTTWHVHLYVAGARVVGARPAPADFQQVDGAPERGDAQTVPAPPRPRAGGADHLHWRLAGPLPGAAGAAPECRGAPSYGLSAGDHPLIVDVRLRRGTRALLAAYDGRWAHTRLALSYLSTTIVFVPLAGLLARTRSERRLRLLRRRLWIAVGAWFVLLVGAAATWLTGGDGNVVTVTQLRPFLLAAALACLLAVAASARRGRLFAAAPLIALVTAAAYVAQGRAATTADGSWQRITQGSGAALAIAVLALTAVTALVWLLLAEPHQSTAGPRWLPRERWVAACVLLVAIALVGQAAGGAYDSWRTHRNASFALNAGLFGDAGSWVATNLVFFAFPFVGLVVDLLPVVGFVLLLAVLRVFGQSARSPVFDADEARVPVVLTLMFAAYVVGMQGDVYAWKVPFAFVLAIGIWLVVGRRTSIEPTTREIAALNGRDEAEGAVLLARARGALLQQAAAPTGANEAGKAKPAAVRLPDRLSPGAAALSLGPGDTWWENARIALRAGSLVALVPIGFFLYVLFSERIGDDLSPWNQLGLADLLRSSVYEVLLWLSAALVLGALFPYLPTSWGAVKGAVLGAAYGLALGVSESILPGGGTGWYFRFFEVFVFFVALGVVLDWLTIRRFGIPRSYLAQHYRVDNVAFSSTYASSAVGALSVIVQQLYSGQGQAAIAEIIKNVPVLIPPVGPH